MEKPTEPKSPSIVPEKKRMSLGLSSGHRTDETIHRVSEIEKSIANLMAITLL
jgi:hypothetical protein